MSSPDTVKFNSVAKFSIRWMRAKFLWFALSFLLLFSSILAIYEYGFNITIDFKGGILIEVGFDDKPNIPEIRAVLHNNNFSNRSLIQQNNSNKVQL